MSPASGSKSLDLAHALIVARAQAPAIAAAEARFRQARAVVDERTAAWRPTIGMPIGYVHNDNGRFVALNGPDEYTLQADVHVPVFDPARTAEYQSARAQLESADLQVEKARHDSDLAALEAYFAVLHSQEDLDVQEAGFKTLQDEERAAQSRFRQGVSSRLDLDRARFALAQQEAVVTSSQATLDTSRRHLENLLGGSAPADLVPPPPARILPDTDLTALARAQRPEAGAAQADLQSAKADVEAAVAARHWPAIGPDILAGWDANGPPSGVVGQLGWSVGVSVTVPIYSGGAGAARIEEARQIEAERAADRNALLRSIDVAIGDDRALAVSASGQARLAAEQVALCQEELQMTHFGYQQGSVPLIEVLRTEQASIQAAADLDDSRLDLELARYRLIWDTGTELP